MHARTHARAQAQLRASKAALAEANAAFRDTIMRLEQEVAQAQEVTARRARLRRRHAQAREPRKGSGLRRWVVLRFKPRAATRDLPRGSECTGCCACARAPWPRPPLRMASRLPH